MLRIYYGNYYTRRSETNQNERRKRRKKNNDNKTEEKNFHRSSPLVVVVVVVLASHVTTTVVLGRRTGRRISFVSFTRTNNTRVFSIRFFFSIVVSGGVRPIPGKYAFDVDLNDFNDHYIIIDSRTYSSDWSIS